MVEMKNLFYNFSLHQFKSIVLSIAPNLDSHLVLVSSNDF